MDKVKYQIRNERGRDVTLSFGVGSETLSGDPVVRWLTPDRAAKLDNTAGIAVEKVSEPVPEKAADLEIASESYAKAAVERHAKGDDEGSAFAAAASAAAMKASVKIKTEQSSKDLDNVLKKKGS